MKVRDQRVAFLRLYQNHVKPFLPKGYKDKIQLRVETLVTFVEITTPDGAVKGRIPFATCFGESTDLETIASLILLCAGVVIR